MSTRATAPKSLTIVGLTHPRMLATSITLPVEILRAAAQASRQRPLTSVKVHLFAQPAGQLALAEGLSMVTEPVDVELIPDVLLIPAIWRNPHWVLRNQRWQLDIIDRTIAAGAYVCSVGTGSYLVAETGRLDHSQATTHWHWFDDFQRSYPAIRLRQDRLITQSGRIFCVGSVNSIADLMVYLAGMLFSRESALAIENQFSPEIRRRFAPHELGTVGESHTDEKILDAQLQLRGQLTQRLNLSALAATVDLSTRSLNRRFKDAVGMGPSAYLNYMRMEEAKRLIHHSNLSMAEIAWSVGIQDPSRFARKFHEHTGVQPRQYRQAVRGKSFTLPAEVI